MSRIVLIALVVGMGVACTTPPYRTPAPTPYDTPPPTTAPGAGGGMGGMPDLVPIPPEGTDPDPGPPTELTDGPRLLFTAEGHHFGPMEKRTKASFTAVFYNGGDETLEIKKVKTHCGCAAALLSSKSIPPGGRGTLRVTLASGTLPGRRAKTVEVFTNAKEEPVAKYGISCDVVADIGLKPILLVIRATRSAGAITAHFDVMAVRRNFKVEIREVKTSHPGIRATVDPLSPDSETNGYRVNLAFGEEFGTGDFHERVTVLTNSLRDPSLTIDVIGSVRQAVLVVPERLYFPRLRPGESVTRKLFVYRTDGKPLGLKNVKNPAGVFETDFKQGTDGKWEVSVTLSGEAPDQDVSGSLLLSTDAAGEPTVTIPFEIPKGAPR